MRQLRRARALSRDELARRVGITKAGLARIERGERFNCANLAPLAAALTCEVRDLFFFGEEQESPRKRLDAVVTLLRSASPQELEVAERLLRALLGK